MQAHIARACTKLEARVTKVEMSKTFAKGTGLEPEKTLTREALAEPHRIYASTSEREDREIELLGRELKDSLKKEILSER
jgi:hypothetical protein